MRTVPAPRSVELCSFCIRVRAIYGTGEALADVEYLYEQHLLMKHGQSK